MIMVLATCLSMMHLAFSEVTPHAAVHEIPRKLVLKCVSLSGDELIEKRPRHKQRKPVDSTKRAVDEYLSTQASIDTLGALALTGGIAWIVLETLCSSRLGRG